ncbi:MAG: hypothetical protein FJW23_01155 [Acidimicrobiia bacterium]|nr:hypothetical protein [Acidimicrobiia bacterium]
MHVNRPAHLGAYEFATLSALRAKQLLNGCVPKLDVNCNAATMAQLEVAAGLVTRAEPQADVAEP